MDNLFNIDYEKKDENKSIKKYYFQTLDIRDNQDPGQAEYLINSSIEFYKNYLEWFYKTFNLNENQLRDQLFSELKLKNNISILITGCGLGHELNYLINDLIQKNLENLTIFAQDYSEVFVNYIYENITEQTDILKKLHQKNNKVVLFNSDACDLPLKDSIFDYAHHFGGINRFSNMHKAISEMSRTIKENGRVMFSDESVAPWLRSDDLGKMIIKNNSLYGAFAPIELLPNSSSDVKLEWIVQNSFYKISFGKKFKNKNINPDIEHKSPRGGSMRKRYFGKIDGIDEKIKEKIIEFSKTNKISQNQIIEKALLNYLSEK